MTEAEARKLRRHAIKRCKRLGFQDDAEDLAHDVLLQYLENPDSHQTITHAVIDAIRARTGRPSDAHHLLRLALFSSSDSEEALDHLVSSMPSPEDAARAEELRASASSLLSKIQKEKRRHVLHAYFFQEKPLKEIGETLSLTESAVSLILRAGLTECREILSSFKNEGAVYTEAVTSHVRGRSKPK